MESDALASLPQRIGISSCLLGNQLRCHPNDYVSAQYYVNPHPRELMLRHRI